MANSKTALSETQADMENMANEIIDLSDQANEANEEANDNLEEQKQNMICTKLLMKH